MSSDVTRSCLASGLVKAVTFAGLTDQWWTATYAYVGIRQHMPAYGSIRQHASAYD